MSLEHLINLSSLPRYETASHPLLLFLTLFAIARIVGPGFRNHWSRDAGDPRPILLTLTTLTVPFNVLGWPAVSVPAYQPRGDGVIPPAVQLVGALGSEELLLGLAAQLPSQFE